MRYLLFILCFFSVSAYGQTAPPPFKGHWEMDCTHYVLDRLVNGDTMIGGVSGQLLKKGVKTLYVQKTEYFNAHADTVMNGYAIKFIDLEQDAPNVYKSLKDSTATLFYMSRPIIKHAYNDIMIMPMYMVKKGRKIKPEYFGNGCKYTFFFNHSNSTFGYDRSSCF